MVGRHIGFNRLPNISLRSPSGIQHVSAGQAAACTLLSRCNAFGTQPRNVVDQWAVTVPKYSEARTWIVDALGISDAINYS